MGESMKRRSRTALGKRLRTCGGFRCIGVLPNWDDYPEDAKQAVREAETVYYPGPLYENVLRTVGKRIHPRNSCHFVGNKIRQTDLFVMLGISHPKTRIYYGRNRVERILVDFRYPFIAKTPVGSSMGKGVYLVTGPDELDAYLDRHLPAYIQEYLPIDKDLRVVVIKGRVIHAYWRIRAEGEFRNNVSRGGSISFENIPGEAVAFARESALKCGFDDVGLDVCFAHGRYYVLEANMVFGFEGFRTANLDFYGILAEMEENGLL